MLVSGIHPSMPHTTDSSHSAPPTPLVDKDTPLFEDTEDIVAILVALKSAAICFDNDRKRKQEKELDQNLPKKLAVAPAEADSDADEHESEDAWDEDPDEDNSEDWFDNGTDKRPTLGTESVEPILPKMDPSPRKKAPSGTACEKHKRWKKRCPEDCPNRKQPKKSFRQTLPIKSWTEQEANKCLELLSSIPFEETPVESEKLFLQNAFHLLHAKLLKGGTRFVKPKTKPDSKMVLNNILRCLKKEADFPTSILEEVRRRWMLAENAILGPKAKPNDSERRAIRDSSMSPPHSGSEGDSKSGPVSPDSTSFGDEAFEPMKQKLRTRPKALPSNKEIYEENSSILHATHSS